MSGRVDRPRSPRKKTDAPFLLVWPLHRACVLARAGCAIRHTPGLGASTRSRVWDAGPEWHLALIRPPPPFSPLLPSPRPPPSLTPLGRDRLQGVVGGDRVGPHLEQRCRGRARRARAGGRGGQLGEEEGGVIKGGSLCCVSSQRGGGASQRRGGTPKRGQAGTMGASLVLRTHASPRPSPLHAPHTHLARARPQSRLHDQDGGWRGAPAGGEASR